MKRVFQLLAIICLVLGIIGFVSDHRDTKGKYEEMKEYPVIRATECSDYRAEEGSFVVITDIHVTGGLVSDSKGLLSGEYYYISARAKELNENAEYQLEWYDEHDMDYELKGQNLSTDAFPGQTFETDKMFHTRVTATIEDIGSKLSAEVGDFRYSYYVISQDDIFTALAQMKGGKLVLVPLYELSDYIYRLGNVEDYYKYLDDFLVGDSALLLIAGIFFALLFGGLAWLWKKKSPIQRAGEQISKIGTDVKNKKMQYAALSDELKKRYWKYRSIGALLFLAGIAMMVLIFYIVFTTDIMPNLLIIIGTILLIIGLAVYNMALPQDYNSGTDIVKMLALDRAYKIDEIYEDYKQLKTPLGSAYLAKLALSNKKAMIWGPDESGGFIYLWLNQSGNIGYLGYACVGVSEVYTEPIYKPQEEFASSAADYICFHSDVCMLQDNLYMNLEHYFKTKEVLAIPRCQPSEVFTFDEDFK